MGGAIARRMLEGGVPLVVFDIDAGAVERLRAAGAEPAASAREVADRASLVIACLPTGGNLRVTREAAGGSAIEVYAELATMSPQRMRETGELLADSGALLVDAPVSGGATIAARGELSLMMAGPPAAMDRLAAAMANVTAHVFRIGERPGQAQLCKLVNNAIGFTVFLASCEALAVGAAGGIDPSLLLDAIDAGEGRNSWTTDKFRQHILSRSFDAGARLTGGPPALDLYLAEAAAVGMPPALVAAARGVWARVIAGMDPSQDFTTMITHFERLTGTELRLAPHPGKDGE